jgi:hypothetical protein
MDRAHARACAVSVMAGNSRRSSTAADNSPLLESGADRGGLGCGDNDHCGRMGVHTEGDKRPVPRFGGRPSWLWQRKSWNGPAGRPAQEALQAAKAITAERCQTAGAD